MRIARAARDAKATRSATVRRGPHAAARHAPRSARRARTGDIDDETQVVSELGKVLAEAVLGQPLGCAAITGSDDAYLRPRHVDNLHPRGRRRGGRRRRRGAVLLCGLLADFVDRFIHSLAAAAALAPAAGCGGRCVGTPCRDFLAESVDLFFLRRPARLALLALLALCLLGLFVKVLVCEAHGLGPLLDFDGLHDALALLPQAHTLTDRTSGGSVSPSGARVCERPTAAPRVLPRRQAIGPAPV